MLGSHWASVRDKEPLRPSQVAMVLVGAVLAVAGIALLWIAIAPLVPVFDVFSDPVQADQQSVDEFKRDVDAAVAPAALGFAALLAGAILLTVGLTRKRRSVDAMIEESLARREQDAAAAAEAARAADGSPQVDPPGALTVRCPRCGGAHLADQRPCPHCGAA